jgi:serine/threonine-protein kinase RsbW
MDTKAVELLHAREAHLQGVQTVPHPHEERCGVALEPAAPNGLAVHGDGDRPLRVPARQADRAGQTLTTVSIHSLAEVSGVIGPVLGAMAVEGYPAQDAFAMRLALDEALVNAIEHGHGGDAAKEVRVRYEVTAERAVVEVTDQGAGFDRQRVPDPLAPENLETPSGRGLLVMRDSLTWLRHNERGNAVTLCKHRSLP